MKNQENNTVTISPELQKWLDAGNRTFQTDYRGGKLETWVYDYGKLKGKFIKNVDELPSANELNELVKEEAEALLSGLN